MSFSKPADNVMPMEKLSRRNLLNSFDVSEALGSTVVKLSIIYLNYLV